MKALIHKSLLLLASSWISASAATILIDYDDGDSGNGVHDTAVRDGDFTQALANSFAPWVSLGTGIPQIVTTSDSGVGSTANYATTLDRILAINTNYTIAVGATLDLSFMWRDAANWDSPDTVGMILYYTDDNTIDGSTNSVLDGATVTTLIDFDSGSRVSVAAWQTETLAGASFSNPAAIGKNLFVRFE